MLVFPSEMANMMYHYGAVQFDTEQGYLLNIHRDYPEAPRSPFYIDLGPILRSVVRFRRMVVDGMIYMVHSYCGAVDFVSDIPQKSTPYIASLSDTTNIPMISPRMGPKSYGNTDEIIGICPIPGMRVAICDDLRTTNKSFLRVIDLYRGHGLEVAACLGIIDRGLIEGSPIHDIPYFSFMSWSQLLRYYHDKGRISPVVYEKCLEYPVRLQVYLDAHRPLPIEVTA